MKKFKQIISLASAFFIFAAMLAPVAYADVNNGGLSGSCNVITDCGNTRDFYSGACNSRIGDVDDCSLGTSWDSVSFTCNTGCTGSCDWPNIRCGSECQEPKDDDGDDVGDGDGVVDGLTCAEAGLGFNA